MHKLFKWYIVSLFCCSGICFAQPANSDTQSRETPPILIAPVLIEGDEVFCQKTQTNYAVSSQMTVKMCYISSRLAHIEKIEPPRIRWRILVDRGTREIVAPHPTHDPMIIVNSPFEAKTIISEKDAKESNWRFESANGDKLEPSYWMPEDCDPPYLPKEQKRLGDKWNLSEDAIQGGIPEGLKFKQGTGTAVYTECVTEAGFTYLKIVVNKTREVVGKTPWGEGTLSSKTRGEILYQPELMLEKASVHETMTLHNSQGQQIMSGENNYTSVFHVQRQRH